MPIHNIHIVSTKLVCRQFYQKPNKKPNNTRGGNEPLLFLYHRSVHSQFTDLIPIPNLCHLIRDKKIGFKQIMLMFCCVLSWKKTGNNFILYNKCDHYQWLQIKPLHLTCHINSYCMYTDDSGALSLTFCHPSHPLGHHHPCTTSSPLSFHFQEQWQFECSFVVAAAFDDQSIDTFLLPTVH